MKNKRKLITILFMLSLSLPLLLASPVNAAYLYGYKAGDKYTFHSEMTYSSDTPSGKGSYSTTYDFTLAILDVIENYNGHRVNIQYTLVGGFGGDPVTQGSMEGNPTSFTSGSSLSPVAALFVTTDWDNRSIEWSEYVNSHYVGHTGYTVQSITKANGEFSVNVNLDVDAAHSDVDFNGDGTDDAYTGTISRTISYDNNGVLKSASTTQTMTTPDKGTVTASSVTENQSTPGLSAANITQILTFVAAVAVAALTLGIGFFFGKRRVRKGMPQMPPIQTS